VPAGGHDENREHIMVNIEQYAAKSEWDPPLYSQAVKVSGAQTILYIAGQVAYDDKGNAAHRGDFNAQARATLQALKAQVEAGGGTMKNIVKVNTYLTDIRHRADYGPIREEFFGKKMPAHTLVAVAALAQPEFLIEVEAVAVI
jgi:enamine deaminase RidA (YjgF/YER057c/UK114 family)